MQTIEAVETRPPVVPSSLRVPKATGTHGDTLVAWGLALLSYSALSADGRDCEVRLRDDGDAYSLHLEMEDEHAKEHPNSTIHRGSWLKWLASSDKGKVPPESFRGEKVDRDQLRSDSERLRAMGGGNAPVGGDAPLVTTETDARRYPLYQVLTNPGTQWTGYNSLVEALAPIMSEAGWRLIIDMYHPVDPLGSQQIDARLRVLGVSKRDSRWRNPPGFLFPGLNKGSTMLLRTQAGTIIGNSTSDWMMSDRGDRNLIELYLAYLGYFEFAQVLTSREERVVVVPAPWMVEITRAQSAFGSVDLRYSGLHSYMEAMAALRYAHKVAQYLRELRDEDPDEFDKAGTVLSGVHITHYWMPSGNTYAPKYTGTVPMPGWLKPLRDEDIGVARDAIEYHQNRLRQIRGGGDPSKLPEERREAIRLYERSLDGDVVDWFHAVASWYAAGREADPENVGKYLWNEEEVRRIAVAVKSDITQIIDTEAFKGIASAIRSATIAAHYARQRHRSAQAADGDGPRPARSPFSAQYDLVTTLMEAADRDPKDFLEELYRFAALYNDETIRRSGPDARRRMIRQEHLDQVTRWVLDEKQRHLVPYALVAFGTSSTGGSGEAQADHVQEQGTEAAQDEE